MSNSNWISCSRARGALRYAFGDSNANAITGGNLADALYGGAGADVIDGRAGNDRLEGNAGEDVLHGGAGADELWAGKDADRLLGGIGNDTYYWYRDEGFDTIIDFDDGTPHQHMGDGVGTIIFDNAALGGTLTAEGDSGKLFTDAFGRLYAFSGDESGRGTLTVVKDGIAGGIHIQNFASGDLGITLPNVAPPTFTSQTGTGDDDTLISAASYEQVFGLGGNDQISLINIGAQGLGGAGDDRIQDGAEGSQQLYGEAGRDILIASGGDDQLYGGLDGDALQGGADDDYLEGNEDSDFLAGGIGEDVLMGGDGDDHLFGDASLSAIGTGWAITYNETETSITPQPNALFQGLQAFDSGDADVLHGGAGNDYMFGEGGDDYLDGGAGNDKIYGQAGDDVVYGGEGDDRINGNQGTDVLFGGEGNDLIFGDTDDVAFADYLDGGAGDDALHGGGGDDILIGGAGRDELVGGAGADVLSGGDDDDELYGDLETTPVAEQGADHLDGGAGDDYLEGWGGSDQLLGGVGNDVIFGDDGDDYIDGGTGLDQMSGGAGADVLFGGSDADLMHGDDGDDFLDGEDGADQIAGDGGNDTLIGGAGNDVMMGLDGDDSLYGGTGSDVLHGGAGNDYLEGGDGFDLLNGGAGDDSYAYDALDTITDSEGANRIVFGSGITPESLSVGSVVVGGRPTLVISASGDVGAGLENRGVSLTSSNFVYAFADGRTLSQLELLQVAYSTPQSIPGTAGNDTLTGFAGNDNISGAGGNDSISGGGGNDSLNGGDGDDTLLGGSGNDLLNGDAGNDTLSGGAGADNLRGGDGADTYLFGYGDGSDTVNDIGNDGAVDTIRLADGISLADVTLTHQPNDDLTLTLNATQERLTLSGWYAQGPFAPSRVEQIAFSDGTLIGETELAALSIAPISGTAGGDVLIGTAFADTLQGFAGDDVLDGGSILFSDVRTNDLLLGGEGHDTYVLRWHNDRDTVIEEAGETSTIRLDGGMTFDDVVVTREGDDLFVHGRRTEHGLLLKNYYTQAHDWNIQTASGASLTLPEFLARPAPTTGDPVRDLWEARKTQFKHEWYGFGPPLARSFTVQADGRVYEAPDWSAFEFSFTRTYDNGDWTVGSGGLPAGAVVGTREATTAFGAENVLSSDAASQFWRLDNTSGTTTTTDAAFDIAWNAPLVSRTTQFLGTFIGFDLLLHSLYRTTASASLSGAVQGMTLNATNGASGPDIVNAVLSGGALPALVDGVFESTTAIYSPVEIRGGASGNAIELVAYGMVDGGGGNDVIDAVGGGGSSSAAGGNFLYGGAGNDGITGSGDGDLISGGPGNDTLAGWAGDDTFYFFASDVGVDIVNEATWFLWDWYSGLSGTALYNTDSGFGSEDTVEFGSGINLADLTLSWGTYESRYWTSPTLLKTYETLDIFWDAGKGVRVMMPDRFDTDVRRDMTILSPGDSWGIEHFKFADGTTLSLEEMVARIPTQILNGTAGDDFLDGSAGNNEFFGGSGFDDLYGAFGIDVYHFNIGDGEDFIRDPGGSDKVVFGTGITPEMLSLGVGSMRVRVGSGGDELHIEYFDPNDPFRTGAIETYEFHDGTVLTHEQLLARGFDVMGNDLAETLNGTAVVDRMFGFGGNDTLVGGAGADVLDGGMGDDTLNGGVGADTMTGGLGNDTYVVESTGDIVIENAGEGTDLVQSSISYTLADGIENLTLTDFASINGTGNALNNVIIGNSGSNVLAGLGGNDTLSGAGANDTLDGGTGADTMNGGDGNDTYIVDDAGDIVGDSSGIDLVLSSISYTMPLSIENLTLTGTADINAVGHNSVSNVIVGNSGANRLEGGLFRSDSLFGMGGNDTLVGGLLNDLLDGGAGADTMEGDSGNDTYVVDDLADVVIDIAGTDLVQASITYSLTEDLENLTLIGAAQIDGTGNALNNVMSGNSSANVLFGLAGNDTLNGGGGADTLYGGAGDDTYVVNNAEAVIVENAGEGTDLVQASIGYTLADNVENLTLTGTGSVDGIGNAQGNVITGNSGANSLFGREGNDTLNGGAEADVMAGGRGDDTYIVDNLFDAVVELGDEGTDLVQSSVTFALGANVENLTLTGGAAINGTGNDLANVITGNAGANVLSGLGGDDTLIGGSANDTLDGGAGADLLDGGAGSDSMSGGTGDDTYVVDSAGDVVSEAAASGSDTVRSGLNYTLGVNLENLALIGSGNINGTGNTLANSLTGNSGSNILDGGAGNDVLMGGEGGDSYRFDLGTGLETIEETDAQGDDIDTLLLGAGITTANLLGARSGQDLVLTIQGASDQLTLRNWFAATSNRIERTQFTDGTVWNAATLEALVAPPNSPPVVAAPIADQAATEDAQFAFTVPADTFTDPDAGDTLTYTATRPDGTALPAWLTFDGVTRTFSGTPANGDVSSIDVRVTATDDDDAAASDTFVIAVANVNDAPTVENAITDQAATEDTAFTFTVPGNTFADVDVGDGLVYSATRADGSELPAWLTFDAATRTLSGTPLNADVGSVDIRVTATDGSNSSVADTFSLAVGNTNDAPTLVNAIADQEAVETVAFSFTVPANTFADVDVGDSLSYSATLADGSPLPGWVDFNAATRTFSGTPANADIGSLSVKVTATDVAGTSSADVFALTVLRENHAPTVVNPFMDWVVVEDGYFGYHGFGFSEFADPDGDAFTLSAALSSGAPLPSWLLFYSPYEGLYNFDVAPPEGAAGLYTVRVTATDTRGAAGFDDFIVEVANGATGTTGADVLIGTAGRDFLYGLGGNDTLSGLASDDYLDGGPGSDSMSGGAGDDTFVVDATGDTVTENASEGVDTVKSSVTWTLSPNLENLTLTGTAAINGTGNAVANVLYGNSSANTLTGGDGDDTLDGGAGNDTMVGGAGNDTYVVDAATDVVTEGSNGGTDTVLSSVTLTLATNVENLTLTGTAAINATGNASNNVLRGDTNSAANILTGLAGDDTYIVGVGDTVVEASNKGTDTVQADFSTALAANVENLTLTGTAVINGTGNTLANVLTGNSAANILDGAAGADTMIGGAGDDTYVVDVSGDVVTENPGEGTDTVQTALTYTLGANVENLTLTGTAAVNGTGNALDNVLTGNSATNSLTGGAGNDTLNGGLGADFQIGGAGDDTYHVDNAGDTVTESFDQGVDSVQSSITYTLGVNVENLTLTGTAAINGTGNDLNNVLVGNSAANTLTGGLGNDTLDGGGGTDTLVGGWGDDIYIDPFDDVLTEEAEQGQDWVYSSASYTLGANVESLVLTGTASIDGSGNASNNFLRGNAAANTLSGGAGNDSLSGGEGDDTLIGGTGDDTYSSLFAGAGDVFIELPGEGNDTVKVDYTYTLGANLENLFLGGDNAIDGTGNDGNNLIIGNLQSNTLIGGAGNDELDGLEGADIMIGGTGDDAYYVDDVNDVVVENAGEGIDFVMSYLECYTLPENVEDLMLGTIVWGANTIYDGTGNALDNRLTGNYYDNVLDGGAGADWMYGSLGNDTYVVDNAGDEILEFQGEGIDTVRSSISFAFELLAVENLVLTGTATIDGTGNNLNNVMTGNDAANVLTSSGGNDRLDGKGGSDTLVGGTGNDTYVLGRGYGADSIHENDATAGNIDVAEFLSGVARDQIWFQQSGNNLVVSIIGTPDQFTMQDWYLGNAHRVEQFRTASADTLLESQVQNLVDAMAAFVPPAPGQTTLPPDYATQLNAVIAGNWQ